MKTIDVVTIIWIAIVFGALGWVIWEDIKKRRGFK